MPLAMFLKVSSTQVIKTQFKVFCKIMTPFTIIRSRNGLALRSRSSRTGTLTLPRPQTAWKYLEILIWKYSRPQTGLAWELKISRWPQERWPWGEDAHPKGIFDLLLALDFGGFLLQVQLEELLEAHLACFKNLDCVPPSVCLRALQIAHHS